jgi:hypothetical protein
VIDDDGVEMLLGVERRSHDPPDEPAEPPLERAIDRRLALGHDLPTLIQSFDLARIVKRRGRRE